MYLKGPGMRRSEGNTFEVAELPAQATCKLCRTKVGLPKTIRFHVHIGNQQSSPGFNGAFMPLTECCCSDDHATWSGTPQSYFGVPMTDLDDEKAARDWVRSRIAQCPSYHVLVIQQGIEPRFGMLRSQVREFESQGIPYTPDFDIGSVAPRVQPSRYELLMED